MVSLHPKIKIEAVAGENYDVDILSVAAGRTKHLIDRYRIHSCPDSYQYKRAKYITFRAGGTGEMDALYKIIQILIIPAGLKNNLITLENYDLSPDIIERLKKYVKESPYPDNDRYYTLERVQDLPHKPRPGKFNDKTLYYSWDELVTRQRHTKEKQERDEEENRLSLLNKRWILHSPAPDKVDEFARSLGVSPVVARLLVNRKMQTVDEARIFMESSLSSLHDPFLITGMESAVDRILRAIKKEESIRLFCDYDVDGVTSAAFLTHFFRDIGVKVRHYLPERMKEGYGLNGDAVRTIREAGDSLMITADCGITSVREVELAHSLGLDVIITDHHQVGSEGLPKAVAVLNPHRSDCDYPYRFLSGVGLAFKLAVAVRNALHNKAGWDKDKLPNMKRHLDLVALGTIADVAPLTGENHVLVRHGLEVLTTTDKAGLIALKDVANVDNRVDARAVGFALGPRLNAAGRLGKADSGFHLLTSVDLNEAKELARNLDAVNQERKKIQGQVQEEADYLIGREVDLAEDRVIVLASENFHSGVVGIVASRMVEKYFRPVVLIALDNGIGKGSGRSIPRFNLHRAFTDCASHLVQFGGHAYAAGLTINEDCVDSFRGAMNEVSRRILSDEDMVAEIFLDALLKISEVNVVLQKQITRMEPFGAENRSPIFLIQGVSVSGLKRMGREETHVRFQAIQDGAKIDAVGFNLAEEFASINVESDTVDLACEFQVNDWNGRNKLELKILDLRHPEKRQ